MPQTTSSMLSAYITTIELIITLLQRIANESRTAIDDMNKFEEDENSYDFVDTSDVVI
ncbi:hypothetical protein [Alternaria dianthicola negative-stranded RNA virus 1]|uniref:Uncharacterized protein n=1 Tax=Alternaria dianthicola negative-stranded RNA virus 1 TaxID=2992032 RepID=A0A9E8AFH5_9MONO|nr:hypothetical protein [Alternaria dianthicola negative-stranded RNA virus 1]